MNTKPGGEQPHLMRTDRPQNSRNLCQHMLLKHSPLIWPFHPSKPYRVDKVRNHKKTGGATRPKPFSSKLTLPDSPSSIHPLAATCTRIDAKETQAMKNLIYKVYRSLGRPKFWRFPQPTDCPSHPSARPLLLQTGPEWLC